MFYSSAILILGVYFEKRLVLANSISFVGISSGQLISPPVFRFLIDSFGWRGAMFIISAISMHVFLSAAVFRPKKIKQKTSMTNSEPESQSLHDSYKAIEVNPPDGSYSNKKSSILKSFGIPTLCINPHFMLTILVLNNISMSLLGTVLFIIPLAEATGLSKHRAALLVTFVGVGGFIGRLGHGIAIDRHYITMPNIFMSGLFASSVIMILIPVFDIYAILVTLCLFFGVSNGIVSSLTMVIPREVVGATPDLIRPALGLAMLVAAGGQFFGGLVAGKDTTNFISLIHHTIIATILYSTTNTRSPAIPKCH